MAKSRSDRLGDLVDRIERGLETGHVAVRAVRTGRNVLRKAAEEAPTALQKAVRAGAEHLAAESGADAISFAESIDGLLKAVRRK